MRMVRPRSQKQAKRLRRVTASGKPSLMDGTIMQPRDKFFSSLMEIRSASGLTSTVERPAVVEAGGVLDAGAMEKVRSALTTSAQQGCWNYVIDLSDVHAVDSNGLALLVSALRSLRDAGGYAALVTGRPDMQRILELCARSRNCLIFSSTSEACSALQSCALPKTAA